MLVVFVHGWGVRRADYGVLPRWLQQRLSGTTRVLQVWLSDYVSYSDDLTMEDLAHAFESARLRHFANQSFACVTHSTGGVILRLWLERFAPGGVYGAISCPLTHLIMLAPPHHGSALAQLGKGRLSRMKFWLQGVEPGIKILDWLEMGSQPARLLHLRGLRSGWLERGVFLFVLTGDGIDPALYDHLNSYTAERGSDGVVRTAASNLNFTYLSLVQNAAGHLEVAGIERSPECAFGILRGFSHCGAAKGILGSVSRANVATHPTALWVERCLQVSTATGYRSLARALREMNGTAPQSTSMVTFRVSDTSDAAIPDFDLLLTAGANHDPDALPRGFLVDRQRNRVTGNALTFYLDYRVMTRAKQFGFRLSPRPDAGPVYFTPAVFTGELATVKTLLRPQETLLVDIRLQRHLRPGVFGMRPFANA